MILAHTSPITFPWSTGFADERPWIDTTAEDQQRGVFGEHVVHHVLTRSTGFRTIGDFDGFLSDDTKGAMHIALRAIEPKANRLAGGAQ